MEFKFDTVELAQASFDTFASEFESMEKIEQLEAVDNFLEAAQRLDIQFDFSKLSVDGGTDMGKLNEVDIKEVTDVIKVTLSDHKTLEDKIKELEATVAKKDEDIEALVEEKSELTEKLTAATNTIKEQEEKFGELSKAHKVLVDEKEKAEAQKKFDDRMNTLKEAGVDTDNMEEDEKKVIAKMSDEDFAPWVKVVASVKPKVEEKPEEEPKTKLAQASKEIEGIENKEEESESSEGYTGVIRQLSVHTGVIRA